ncbi:RNA polymerase sigma-70 factor [Dysgonomonas sp. Marseille-P4677]|uniref:RNA polymerase sigma-70 factor n=1 Tax=Dysgonomonas sp. Marseille-P4677 TaxID=2364790 RepID=UPI0019112B5B|nr:RNA polymerase sigma-70 factor [Dysgonomonas sp. Marseille-P4677]MBK5720900.1 RNA polymerase sigma-70 factor [Dysgonomonas sp. Marseille-P4677]
MMNNQKTDSELALLLSRESQDAFKELYIRYKDKLYHYCFHFLKSEEDTNDVIQEIFIRLWEIRNFINPELSFSAFIYTMARNRILNYLRDCNVELQVKKAVYAKASLIKEEGVEAELIFSEYQQIFIDAIDKLPHQRKKIFNMSRKENLSHKEIAEQLGISVHTVQEHISESLRFIKTYFNQHSDLVLGILVLFLI